MNNTAIKTNKELGFLFTFIIIFVSNDTLMFGTNSNRLFFWIHIGIQVAFFFFMLTRIRSISRHTVLFTVTLLFFMMATLLVNRDGEIIKYAYSMLILMMSAVFISYISKDRFCNAFVGIVYHIALWSIGLFVLWLVAPSLVRYFPSITNESDIKYYYLGLGFLEDLDRGVLPRMYGIFREPGVFACYLILSLIIQIFFLKEMNLKRAVIISLAALLTFSTAAYILLVLVYVVYFAKQLFNNNPHKKTIRLLFCISIIFTFVFFSIGPEKIMSAVFNKLKVENSSRDSRFASISANFLMFLENPLFGKGWNYVEDNFIRFASIGIYNGNHNTNTFLKLLALYGIFPFVGIIGALSAFFIKETKSFVWGMLTALIWIITLSNEDLTVNVLMYLLPFYAFSKETKMEERL